jgi:hypothetical protein
MNNNSLDQLKEKRKLWIECMSGKDRNSILNQINNLVWNAAVFKVINESRKYIPESADGERQSNEMLHTFINRCFFDSQFSAIRRLTDKAYDLDDRKRGINSLCALLLDMKAAAPLMTRENMFDVDDLEYDYEIIKGREEAYHQERNEKGISTYWMPEKLSSKNTKKRHEELDILCGTKLDHRDPSDCIQSQVFDFLLEKLGNIAKDINLYVNKNIAHAATLGSREHAATDDLNITFESLWHAHKVICQTANFVDLYLLRGAYHAGVLPVPQYNHFEFIDNPIVIKENIGNLRETWNNFQKESESWSAWSLDDLKREIAQLNNTTNR